MNKFGGDWTENKIEILVEYAGAYLTIMNKYADTYNWKLLYFDGFAGSGFIKKGKKQNEKIIVGAARRILEINDPRPFDMYYFVEKDDRNTKQLELNTKDAFPEKVIYVANEDCNKKIEALSRFLTSSKGKKYRTLAYIDPCGMQLEWKSLVALQKLSVDVWILVPTGLGVNRLLKRDGQISDAWQERLSVFLGMEKTEILEYFYQKRAVATLFGVDEVTEKEERAIEKSAELYRERLNNLFKFVSDPYILKNKTNSVMFHFLMATNNETAINIANSITRKYNKLN